MKSLKTVVVLGLGVLLMAVQTQAQFGLPVAESYEARETGILDFTAGAMLSDDIKCFAVRDTFSVAEDIRLFLDLGLVDVERNEQNLAVQAGLVFCLPVDVPVDMGLRTSGYWFNGDVDEVRGVSALLLASGNPVFEGLYVYGGGGVEYRETDTDLSQLDLESDDGVEAWEDSFQAVITFGALMPLAEHLWFFAEATYNDDPFLAIGLRTR